jgi:hypothetical protein
MFFPGRKNPLTLKPTTTENLCLLRLIAKKHYKFNGFCVRWVAGNLWAPEKRPVISIPAMDKRGVSWLMKQENNLEITTK